MEINLYKNKIKLILNTKFINKQQIGEESIFVEMNFVFQKAIASIV